MHVASLVMSLSEPLVHDYLDVNAAVEGPSLGIRVGSCRVKGLWRGRIR
jgi:hypothetical protein